MLFDNALLLCISADPSIGIAELRALHLTQELLVMGDDNELEILLLTSSLNDLVQRLSESFNVVLIKVRRRFIKSNDLKSVSINSFRHKADTYTAILTKTLR